MEDKHKLEEKLMALNAKINSLPPSAWGSCGLAIDLQREYDDLLHTLNRLNNEN